MYKSNPCALMFEELLSLPVPMAGNSEQTSFLCGVHIPNFPIYNLGRHVGNTWISSQLTPQNVGKLTPST